MTTCGNNSYRNSDKKVLILGATGMLGHTLYMMLQRATGIIVHGTVRESSQFSLLESIDTNNLVTNIDVDNVDLFEALIDDIRPDLVINCIGIVKPVSTSDDVIRTLKINTLFPHELAKICADYEARMIHISTDCVFDGLQGEYREVDPVNATDLYGLGKFLGEVNHPNVLTLRTSIIGHELGTTNSLIEWFLRQNGVVRGYRNAIFSGLTTYELARIIKDYLIPLPDLYGVYHVASDPISKFDLLQLVAKIYECDLVLQAQNEPRINRSLNSERFKNLTGYSSPCWSDLVQSMYKFYKENYKDSKS